jgi:hypothetical protein
MAKHRWSNAEALKCFGNSDPAIRRKILVKIFAGPVLEDRLVSFVSIFTKRRGEFKFALSVHTAICADEANLKLSLSTRGRPRSTKSGRLQHLS